PGRGGVPRCAVDPRWACTTAAAMSTAASTTLFLIAGRFYRRPPFGCRFCPGLGVLPTGLENLQELQQIRAFLCIEVDRVLRPVRGIVVGVAVQVVDDLLERRGRIVVKERSQVLDLPELGHLEAMHVFHSA